MNEARYYTRTGDGKTKCLLCPHFCLLESGEAGICRVRRNQEGILVAESYGRVSALNSDPVEKKPLYHYFPGNMILSVGSYGCNFRCAWCQNAAISQCGPGRQTASGNITPKELAEKAVSSGGIGLAYTYNEPAVWFEFMVDTARLVREAGRKNVVVTNGFINRDPLEELIDECDAFNVDLKSFSHDFYRRHTGGSLSPVLNTIQAISGRGLHLEISFLVVTGLNENPDTFRDMVAWLSKEAGSECVLHINRYFPSWNMSNPPSPLDTLMNMKSVAEEYLDYVYLGNVH